MEYAIKCGEKSSGAYGLSRVTVERGRVVSATPAFSWAVGGGLHVLLSWCQRKGLKWERVRPARRRHVQMELGL